MRRYLTIVILSSASLRYGSGFLVKNGLVGPQGLLTQVLGEENTNTDKKKDEFKQKCLISCQVTVGCQFVTITINGDKSKCFHAQLSFEDDNWKGKAITNAKTYQVCPGRNFNIAKYIIKCIRSA